MTVYPRVCVRCWKAAVKPPEENLCPQGADTFGRESAFFCKIKIG
jgi:hypothetical protein